MKIYRTSAQWQQLLQQRNDFSGTNIQFCQHHRISISNYYKHRALRVEKLPKQPVSIQTPGLGASHFVQVKQTTEVSTQTHQSAVQFDTRTGQLSLPVNLAMADIVTIIKGLTV